jgi:exodeoxyribonuclease V alpha subunit
MLCRVPTPEAASSHAALVSALRAASVLSPLDEQLARTLCAIGDERDERVLLAAALVSRHVTQGHVCLPMAELASGAITLGDDATELPANMPAWPTSAAWLAALRASPLCGTTVGETTPLVLDSAGRLYLRRHFERERALARDIRQRVQLLVQSDQARVAARLVHYFGDQPDDRQRAAAQLAMRRAFCVISGGPGTGKTSTVVKILAVAIEEALAQGTPAPRIALLAPTGKAAVRLELAVRSAKLKLDCEPAVREAIPEQASTIHRALRARLRGRYRGRAAPLPELPLDLLLVDEASMVDLELMTELFGALPALARVILLGDRDQLASVEAGAVLGDMCGGELGESESPAAAGLSLSVIELTRSYRYAADSGIGQLARAIQAGAAERALAILDDPKHPDVQLCAVGKDPSASDELRAAIIAGYQPYLEACSDPVRALQLFDAFRILCAHRQGRHGVAALNRFATRVLYEANLIDRSEGNFIGRPLLITENDYRNRLWNGDVGLVTRDARGQQVSSFVAPDGEVRQLGFGRLPPHESAFALSVHKSQGSEVDSVSLVLPDEPSRVLSRELLYTAITRARQRVVIYGERAVLVAAIERRVARSTGLRELLYARS